MKKRILRYFVVTVVVITILTFQNWNVAAQLDRSKTELPYKELVIQLMPEYVNPSGWTDEGPVLLYGQHGVFLNETDEIYEGNFTVDVPLDEPNFYLALVGKFDDQGQVDELEYTMDENAGTITWTPVGGIAPGEEYRYVLEYYYSPFQVNEAKEFSFDYQFDREIEMLTVLVFEPYGIEEMTLSLQADRVTNMFGVPVHTFEYEGLSAGENFNIDISYVKDNNISTLEALEAQRPPNDETHAGIGGNPGQVTGGNGPFITTENAVMISISIIIAGLLVFLGLRSYKSQPVVEVEKPSLRTKVEKVDVQAEKKRLRQQLMDGDIDENTYKTKMRKLS